AQVHRAYRAVASEAMPAVTHLAEADRDMQRALVAERSLIFMKNDSPAAQEQRRVHAESLAQAGAHWKAYTALPASAEERALWAGFETARTAWDGGSREVLKLLGEDSADARKDAIDVSLSENTTKFEVARKALAMLGAARRRQAEAQVLFEERRLAHVT